MQPIFNLGSDQNKNLMSPLINPPPFVQKGVGFFSSFAILLSLLHIMLGYLWHVTPRHTIQHCLLGMQTQAAIQQGI